MSNFSFLYKNWLRPGCKWHSPYHQIAYQLAMRARNPNVQRMLDCGLVTRTSHFFKHTPSVFTATAIGQLEYLRGNHVIAADHLISALENPHSDEKDIDRAIKLMSRLAPEDLIAWLGKRNKIRLQTRLQMATDSIGAATPLLPSPIGDEHLLNANYVSDFSEKLNWLNSYWQEAGLAHVRGHMGSRVFDINCLACQPAPSSRISASAIPTVSVIMTVYNGGEYLRAAALSILHQTEVPVELIIVDDGSTDETWHTICSLKEDYPGKILCERLPENIGTYRAKNIALGMCKREYVAFQDADDWSHPERLSRALGWLDESHYRIAVTCRYVRLTQAGIFYSPNVWPLKQWSPNTLVMRRQAVTDAIGRFDETAIGGDTDYFERIRAHFGDHRLLFQKEAMVLAMGLPQSLMHHPATGINDIGYSEKRVAYRDQRAEMLLHGILNGTKPFLRLRS